MWPLFHCHWHCTYGDSLASWPLYMHIWNVYVFITLLFAFGLRWGIKTVGNTLPVTMSCHGWLLVTTLCVWLWSESLGLESQQEKIKKEALMHPLSGSRPPRGSPAFDRPCFRKKSVFICEQCGQMLCSVWLGRTKRGSRGGSYSKPSSVITTWMGIGLRGINDSVHNKSNHNIWSVSQSDPQYYSQPWNHRLKSYNILITSSF